MAKRPTEQQTHSWAVYHIRGTPAQLVGIEGHRGIRGAGKSAQSADRAAAELSNPRMAPSFGRCIVAGVMVASQARSFCTFDPWWLVFDLPTAGITKLPQGGASV
jgi:hypothetical protein